MFWSKKKKVDIELEQRHEDSRQAFRVAPDRAKPIILTLRGSTFHALNISADGVAFRSHNFPEGSIISGTMRLPSEDKMFPMTIQVVSKNRDLCRCQFTQIHEEAQNLLHSYILELQKNKIRELHGR